MKHKLFIFSLFFLYILAITLLMFGQGIAIAPSRYLFVLIFGVLVIKKVRNFILDWIPFLLILISYDFIRGLAGTLISQTRYLDLVYIDLWLFKFIPTAYLQSLFFHSNNLAWYDYVGTIIYFFHSILPVSFGFLLWIYHKSGFKEFITGFFILSYIAFLTWIIFPTAPPWMLSQDGKIAGVTKVMTLTLNNIIGPGAINYHNTINSTPVGSFPSVHAAYPFIIFLFALRYFKIKALIFLPYVLSIWFFIVYSGEHYIIDVAGGVLYASFSYLLSTEILHQLTNQKIIQRLFYNCSRKP